jgi:hypothetical protein
MGESALKNRDAIIQASQAAVKLGFDDEDAAESITKLYQRTNDLNKAMDLNALAMDYARAKGVELSEATQVISLALSGGGRALKDFGIEINESLGPMEALAELQTRVKGNADAFATTFQGQMQVLSTEFENIKETVGGALLEAIMPFIKQLSDWASKPDVQEKVAAFAMALGYWASVVLPAAVTAVTFLFNGIKQLYDMLVNFEVKMFSVIDTIGKFVKATANVASSAGSGIKNAASAVGNFVSAPFRADGGPVSGGSPYIVGERGPELFVPSISGSIVPSGGFGGGAITINISGNTLLDESAGYKIGQQIMNTLKMQIRI